MRRVEWGRLEVLYACALIAAVALSLGIAATAAQADEATEPKTSIYLASGPGYSLTLKAEKGRVFAIAVRANSYCRGAGSHRDETNQVVSDFAFEGPTEFDRAGPHVYYRQYESGESFTESEVIDGEFRGNLIVGYFSHESDGEAIDGSCQSGGFDGSSRVPFEARRFVPYDSYRLLGTSPDPSAERLYFGDSGPLEIYLRVGGEAVTDIQGSARRTCAGRRPDYYPPLSGFGDLPTPLLLAGPHRDFAGGSSEGGFFAVESRRIVGRVGEWAVSGGIRERAVERHHGRADFWCRIGPRSRGGYAPFHAKRYLPLEVGG